MAPELLQLKRSSNHKYTPISTELEETTDTNDVEEEIFQDEIDGGNSDDGNKNIKRKDDERITSTNRKKDNVSRFCWMVIVAFFSYAVGLFHGRMLATVVEEVNDTAVSYEFLQTPKGSELLKNSTEQLLQDKSAKGVLQSITAQMDTDEQIRSSCHPVIHYIGRIALQEFGLNGALDGILLREKTDDKNIDSIEGKNNNNDKAMSAPELLLACNGAFMHGIIENFFVSSDAKKVWSSSEEEAFLMQLQNDTNMINSTLCNNAELDLMYKGQWECVHGIGHGVVQRVNFHKIRLGLEMAMKGCNDDVTCVNGVWMDHFASTPMSSSVIGKVALQICYDIPNGHNDCVKYAPTEFLLHHPRKYEEAFEYCKTSLTEIFEGQLPTTFQLEQEILLCTGGVGMQISKENLNDFHFLERMCLKAGDDYQKHCFAKGLNYYKMSNQVKRVPDKLCKNLSTFFFLCLIS